MDSIYYSSNIKETSTLKENIKHFSECHSSSSHTTSSHNSELPENINQVIQDDWGQYIDIETNLLFSNIS